jgi:hypothetical protein
MQNSTTYMSSIVESWIRKIDSSRTSEARKNFFKTAAMCDHFFRGSMGMMWNEDFRREYLANIPAPKFQVTIGKAFEMVAVMGPSIMWDYPGRVIKTDIVKPLPIELFRGDQQRYALYLQDLEQETITNIARNGLMESYLNYSHREQPGGGLIHDSHLAITDAIVKGAGVQWVGSYRFPGSTRVLTKCEYDRIERLYIDPDCSRANLTDAYWCARERVSKYWEVEEMFGLPPGTLRDKCNAYSRDGLSQATSEADKAARRSGVNDKDLIIWYEVFSKEGIGTRSMKVKPKLDEAFEEVVGDYAYLAIVEGVEYPLNFAPAVANKASDDEVRSRFEWPIPYWTDGRWPFAMLKFYEVPGCPWPLAPLAMGTGELVFLNVIVSCLMERAYKSCGSILAVDQGIEADMLNALKSGDFSGVVEMSPQNQQLITDMIKWIEAPSIDPAVFKIIEEISGMFDRRTGLSDLLYGGHAGGKVSRSSADAQLMHDSAGQRQEWMKRCVEVHQTELADLERIAAGFVVTGEDISPRFGKEAAAIWDELITEADPEIYVRGMRCSIQANSIQKPNKFKDSQNLQAMAQYALPILQTYWEMSQGQDPGPLNAFISALGAAADQDTSEWELPPVQPPQPPQPDPAMQEQAALEAQRAAIADAKAQEELAGKQLRNEKLRMETGAAEQAPPSDAQPAEAPPTGIDPAVFEMMVSPMSQGA